MLPRLLVLFMLSILVSNESLRPGDKRENRFEGLNPSVLNLSGVLGEIGEKSRCFLL